MRVCRLCVCSPAKRRTEVGFMPRTCRNVQNGYEVEKRLTDETVQVMQNLNHPRDIVSDWPVMEMGFLTQWQARALL